MSDWGVDSPATRGLFLNSSYDEFLTLFPAEFRKGLQKSPSPPGFLVMDDDSLHPALIYREFPLDSTKIKQGQLDQKQCYLTSDSVYTWRELINAGQYKVYEECSESLCRLFSDEKNWVNYFGEIDRVVMLGGGGASKDLTVIDSFLAHGRIPLRYMMVDISPYMLAMAHNIVDRNLITRGRKDDVHIVPICCDFMDFFLAGKQIREKGKPVMWVLPGSTLGNIDESAFFSGLRQVAEAGDIVIIGAEVIEKDTDLSAVPRPYEDPAIRGFLAAPLRAAWHELRLDISFEKALANIKPRLVPAVVNGYSSVPGSVAVEFAIYHDPNDPKKKVVLITSAKYREEQLGEVAKAFDFEPQAAIASRLNPNYKQFVFRYVPK